MAQVGMTLREVSADQTRPYIGPIDQITQVVGQVAGSISRWCWVRQYERAEAIYWPESAHK